VALHQRPELGEIGVVGAGLAAQVADVEPARDGNDVRRALDAVSGTIREEGPAEPLSSSE